MRQNSVDDCGAVVTEGEVAARLEHGDHDLGPREPVAHPGAARALAPRGSQQRVGGNAFLLRETPDGRRRAPSSRSSRDLPTRVSCRIAPNTEVGVPQLTDGFATWEFCVLRCSDSRVSYRPILVDRSPRRFA